MITAHIIKDINSVEIAHVSGPLEAVAISVLPPDLANKDSLVFVTKAPQLEEALKAKAPIIVAHKSLTLPSDSSASFFTTASIPLAMSAILPLFDGKMNRFNQTEKIHPTAVIHPTAHVGPGTILGPYVVIGEHAKIGDHCTIGAHTVVESYAEVGAYTLLHPQVFIGAHCILGTHCEIHPHTTIGADGFSFAMAKDGTHKKLPQIGRVVIGNNVEMGANCAVDRAALTETRIGDGTKFDNFVHIAHNCVIGKDCVLAAGFKMAGSSSMGDNGMAGGGVDIADHVHITNKVMLAGRAGVTNDITTSGAYGGYPIEPLRDSLKTIANFANLTRLRKDVAKILKHLNLNDE
jgi:UDP-3-O-[3-hydroxymyristoyl] glucosamine N-acyltransferase